MIKNYVCILTVAFGGLLSAAVEYQ